MRHAPEPQRSRRVRVLWLIKGLGLGGAERLLVLTAGLLDPSRFEIHVAYVLPHKDQFVPDLEAAGVTVHSLGDADAPWPLALRRLLKSGRYDIVHTHSPQAAAAARLLLWRRSRARFVHTEHSSWARYRALTRVANALTVWRNDTIIAVSQGVRDSLRGIALLAPRAQVEVLYHGIDERAVRRGPEARARARERLGIDPSTPVVGTVGSLTPKKAHDVLLDAFSRLRSADAFLLVIGAGPLEGHLRADAARLGISDRVNFLGRRDDVQELLPALDVFALASRHEGLGLAVIEAMAAEVPGVVSASEGLLEVIDHEVTGLLVPPGSASAMASAIDRLLREEGLRRQLGRAGASRASDRFSIDAAVKRLGQVYEGVKPNSEAPNPA